MRGRKLHANLKNLLHTGNGIEPVQLFPFQTSMNTQHHDGLAGIASAHSHLRDVDAHSTERHADFSDTSRVIREHYVRIDFFWNFELRGFMLLS